MTIDGLDRKILTIIQNNARTSNAEIGRRVDLTASAVHERIKKLERRGIIESYSAVVNPDAVGKSLLAYVFVRVRPHRIAKAVGATLARSEGIQEVAHLAGEECFLVKTRCSGTKELESIIYNINDIEGVDGTRTIIALGSVVEYPSLPISAIEGDRP